MPSLVELPIEEPDEQFHRLQIATLVNQIVRGRTNSVGSFTLTANVASTVVADNLFTIEMTPLWVPTTANAAAEIGNGTLYISARANGSFTLTHANNVQADRTFYYARVG